MAKALSHRGAPGPIAILPWSDLIEDFLDHIGVTLQGFAEEMAGGWLFGYLSALKLEGYQALIVVFSGRSDRPQRLVHVATGAPILVLPASRAYQRLRKVAVNPYAFRTSEMFGEQHHGRPLRMAYGALRQVVPYAGTPLLRLAGTLRRHGCSAIVCQEYEYARFDACVVLGKLLGVPVFASYQGGTSPQSALERRVRPLSLRLAAGVVIGASREADRVQATYGVDPAKIAPIPNPVDLREWDGGERAEARAELGVTSDLVIAWHGRIDVFNKGLDVLLAAWATVVERRPGRRFRLLLVGTGRDAPDLKSRLDALGPADVTWINEYVLDKRRVARLLSAADVYAFPSRIEGFAVAPLEAMALGLPIVAAEARGVADLLSEGERSGGLRVPTGDPEAFATALGRLLDDDELRRELGRCARRRAEEVYSLESVGRQLGSLLRSAGVG